ncbi:uncharacterized protein RSE6_06855 [Rhynchosporium secalis]|uniref:DUF6594 domain-containing protein n=1 Tax=Rhynchosporium secalis TaxID=38038 RepID=A0A1E1MBF7_RHYSE|nr:uncharacterized protein RSE6_06855 [Rhynchosporium secalis]
MAKEEEFSIIRRFGALSMQKLLYMQAELIHLESELDQLSKRDVNNRERQFHSKDWYSLSQGETKEDLEQWQKFLEISEKLEAYSDTAVLKHTAMGKFDRPREYDLEFLRSWFRRAGMGSFPLLGLDRDAWVVKTENDLIAIKPRETPDIFSRWFAESFFPRYHRVFGQRYRKELPDNVGSGIYHYRESSLASAFRILVTVMASLLPICSVVALFLVESDGLRLGLIAIFSACFSLALALMTRARPFEVFAATAACVSPEDQRFKRQSNLSSASQQ